MIVDGCSSARISDPISDLLEGLDLEEVAQILCVHLTMLVLQGADEPKESLDFLSEIHRSVAETIKRYPFGSD